MCHSTSDTDALERAEQEVEIMKTCPHPALIDYYDHSVAKRKSGKAEVLLLARGCITHS